MVRAPKRPVVPNPTHNEKILLPSIKSTKATLYKKQGWVGLWLDTTSGVDTNTVEKMKTERTNATPVRGEEKTRRPLLMHKEARETGKPSENIGQNRNIGRKTKK